MLLLADALGAPLAGYLDPAHPTQQAIARSVSHWSGVPEADLVRGIDAGGDDFLVHVAVPGVDGLHAFLMDRFSARREIVGFRSSVIYQHHRNRIIDPGLAENAR